MTSTPTPDLMVFPGTVMVSGGLLPVLSLGLDLLERQRLRDGYRPAHALTELRAAFAHAMSASGQTDVRSGADVQPVEWVSTTEAAQRLGCSTRHARRLAERFGGVRRNGRWQIDALALLEHQKGNH